MIDYPIIDHKKITSYSNYQIRHVIGGFSPESKSIDVEIQEYEYNEYYGLGRWGGWGPKRITLPLISNEDGFLTFGLTMPNYDRYEVYIAF